MHPAAVSGTGGKRTGRGRAALRAFAALEVGPARVEPRRLVCPYRVLGGVDGRPVETALTYRYEEPVFDQDDPASLNLASMIAAQVALNYALFCDRIVFHGPFDRVDRELLAEMAENTAREIYVNKLLAPNRFLVAGAASELPARPLARYCRARIIFADASPPPARVPRGATGDPGSYAVLSSGGKESLLALALLEELGRPAHPVFVNESGRHWYTALNAYRALKAGRPAKPAAARVWTDADRLFGWMLRRLPFVRSDFGRIRADDYPIRLWTVAVFLFGALPVARARRAGRLVIGCEYDTTRRVRSDGIPHYDGLYDQSLDFDRRLTRYLRAKGWAAAQLSLLRPLPELLVQKVLVERYPALQREQVSCHAAHLEGGRARPCGRCEKCRRVVALLTAVGADPTACGYTPAQVASCLRELPRTALHQEAEDARALLALVGGGGGGEIDRPGPFDLRVDPQRAPADLLPPELRAPLWRLWREHAAGAWQRRGGKWTAIGST